MAAGQTVSEEFMSKKIFNLVVGITGGVAAIASAVVTYLDPGYAPAIVGGIGIAETAVVEICNLFVVNNTEKKEEK